MGNNMVRPVWDPTVRAFKRDTNDKEIVLIEEHLFICGQAH